MRLQRLGVVAECLGQDGDRCRGELVQGAQARFECCEDWLELATQMRGLSLPPADVLCRSVLGRAD